MTLGDLESDLYRRLGYATSPATEITTRLRAYLNETQRDLFSEPGMEKWLQGFPAASFASVASTPEYALPPSVSRIVKVYETTNDRALEELSADHYRTFDPDTVTHTGTPTHFVDRGQSAVAKQPSDASEIFVDSTAAGDTNTAYIEGYRTGGYFKALSVSMTGVTAVTFSASFADFIEITKFYLSAAAVGTVTLHEDASGGTELARIPIGQTHARYRRIALWPCPSAAITYSVDYERDIQDMANAKDEPLLPVRFHPLLAIGARMKEYEKREDFKRHALAKREYDERLSHLKYFTFAGPGVRPVMGRSLHQRPSQLGGWYPAGS